MNDQKHELYFELSKQAFNEVLPKLGMCAYAATPNQIGQAMDRFVVLCDENGLCPKCGMEIEDCDCEDSND
jgi:hypothetical protein